MELYRRFEEFINRNDLFGAKDKLLLAVSGGVDSVVLTHLCREAGFDFVIAHCNFHLRDEYSYRDEQFVKELAGTVNVPFYSKSFETKVLAEKRKTSIEETARDLRYEWFNELLDPKRSELHKEHLPKWIVTGHHADDNIETVVMNFFRGTGIKGMRGMLPKQDRVLRPLLFARRKEIEDYALLHQLSYVSDHTNLENEFTRNFFRNRVIPMVREFYPASEQNILHNAERCREIEQLYNQAVDLHRSKLLEQKGNETHIPVLKLKKSTPLHTIVYEIIKDFGFTAHQVPEAIALLESENGKFIASPTHRIIRNRNWLIISPVLSMENRTILIESAEETVQFPLGTLQLKETTNYELPTTNSEATLDLKDISFPLILRPWKPGDYFYPLGMKKKKKIARFLIDLKLSKTEKEKVWVLESNYRILWVVGYRIDERFKLNNATTRALSLKLTPA
jgi:tRNA(Ile)-lysidine synthase